MDTKEIARRPGLRTPFRAEHQNTGGSALPDLAAILDPEGRLTDKGPRIPPGRAAHHLSTTLAFSDYEIRAELAGSRPLPGAVAESAPPPFAWSSSVAAAPPQATAPVCVGTDGSGRLFVDLAVAPGVVTVVGRPAARSVLGAELANRLAAVATDKAKHLAVVIAGEPYDPDLLLVDPTRVRSVAAFDPAALSAEVRICFLFCSLSTADDGVRIEALSRAPGARIVPIVVDDVLGADWSFTVESASRAAAPPAR